MNTSGHRQTKGRIVEDTKAYNFTEHPHSILIFRTERAGKRNRVRITGNAVAF